MDNPVAWAIISREIPWRMKLSTIDRICQPMDDRPLAKHLNVLKSDFENRLSR
jgi:hypothetical protein